MPLRFRKSLKLAPGVRLNFSKSGVSMSVGRRGFSVNTGPRGTRLNASIPGTGLGYSTTLSRRGKTAAQTGHTKGGRGCLTRTILYGMFALVALLACGVIGQLLPDANPSESEPKRTSIPTFTPLPVALAPSPTSAPPPQLTPLVEPAQLVEPSAPVRAQEVAILLPTVTQASLDPVLSQPTPTVDLPAPPVALPPTPTAQAVTEQAPSELAQPAAAVIINGEMNVRQGPGTDYAIVGGALAGESYPITGKDASGTWWQIDYRGQPGWVFAPLVTAQNSESITVVTDNAPPAAAPVTTQEQVVPPQAQAPSTGGNNPAAFVCNGGCATPPDPACNIKGNVNSKDEKIYHTTDSNWYTRTDIKPEQGDRWFCTTAEAEAAGFRPPKS